MFGKKKKNQEFFENSEIEEEMTLGEKLWDVFKFIAVPGGFGQWALAGKINSLFVLALYGIGAGYLFYELYKLGMYSIETGNVFLQVPLCLYCFAYLISLIEIPLFYICKWIMYPFYKLHFFLNGTYAGGPNEHKYKNVFNLIFRGILGNIAYYLIIIIILSTIFAFRPYGEGYIVKQSNLEVGDVIQVKKHDTLSTVVSYNADNKKYTVRNDDNSEINVRISEIKGCYKEYDNMVLGFIMSTKEAILYPYDKVVNIKKAYESSLQNKP